MTEGKVGWQPAVGERGEREGGGGREGERERRREGVRGREGQEAHFNHKVFGNCHKPASHIL